MGATCAITEETDEPGTASITPPWLVVQSDATSFVPEVAPSTVGGEELLQFFRDACRAPARDETPATDQASATDEAPTAELGGDLVEFLRDFNATAPRRVIASASAPNHQTPRRVLLSQDRGRWRAPAVLASMAAANSMWELVPPSTVPVRVPPYIAALTGRGWIAASGGQLARAAS